ncbi:hypothetical protein MMC22_011237 [Lobaria immixta]|nr:hypothetical protein [Lobaria immixta]
MQNATGLTPSQEKVELFADFIETLIQQDLKHSSREIRAHVRAFIEKQRVRNKLQPKGRVRYWFSRRRPRPSTSIPQIPLNTSRSKKSTCCREDAGSIELALSKSDLNQQKSQPADRTITKIEKGIDEH